MNGAFVKGAAQADGILCVAGVGIGDQRRQRPSCAVHGQDAGDQRVHRHRGDLRRQLPCLRQHAIDTAGHLLEQPVGIDFCCAFGRREDFVVRLRLDPVHPAPGRVVEKGTGRGGANVDGQDQGRWRCSCGGWRVHVSLLHQIVLVHRVAVSQTSLHVRHSRILTESGNVASHHDSRPLQSRPALIIQLIRPNPPTDETPFIRRTTSCTCHR